MTDASAKVVEYLVGLIWASGTFFTAALISRLYALDLEPRYRAFVLVLTAQLTRSLLLLCIRPLTNAYAWVYFVGEPALFSLYVMVTLEIYQQVFESYQGLSVLGRRSLWTALVCSLAVSVTTHLSEFDLTHEPIQILRIFQMLETTLCSALLVFLAVVAAFLTWYPAPVRRNLLVYAFGFSLFFATLSAGIFLRNLDPVRYTKLADLMRLSGSTCCLVGWLVLFRKRWEVVPKEGMALHGACASRLLAQLEALNKALEAGRKPPQYTV
ncbi:MAG: hypothetical protein HY858_03005 [Candidatus Solibacter usitatus]|nr:hypothetical protein [Candidatus Solibacter usitatus]